MLLSLMERLAKNDTKSLILRLMRKELMRQISVLKKRLALEQKIGP